MFLTKNQKRKAPPQATFGSRCSDAPPSGLTNCWQRTSQRKRKRFARPGGVQDVFDLSAELKAAATERKYTGIVDALKPTGTADTQAALFTEGLKETVGAAKQ